MEFAQRATQRQREYPMTQAQGLVAFQKPVFHTNDAVSKTGQ